MNMIVDMIKKFPQSVLISNSALLLTFINNSVNHTLLSSFVHIAIEFEASDLCVQFWDVSLFTTLALKFHEA